MFNKFESNKNTLFCLKITNKHLNVAIFNLLIKNKFSTSFEKLSKHLLFTEQWIITYKISKNRYFICMPSAKDVKDVKWLTLSEFLILLKIKHNAI